MPELPEVETVRIQLAEKVIGKTIREVEVLHSKTVSLSDESMDKLEGKIIAEVRRVGKLMIFSFAKTKNLFMLAHLKMTGQFIFVDDDGQTTAGGHTMNERDVEDLPGRHTRVAINFTDNSTLFFNDMRLFGYLRLVSPEKLEEVVAKFGPEPISSEFDIEWFTKMLQKRKAPIKAVLLDQSFVAGLGNIYVDEALWRAKIKPMRLANTLSNREAGKLGQEAGKVMLEAIKVGGTTFQNFVDTGGQHGNFRDYLKVFGRQGQKCSRCKENIEKTRVAGRGTHYCPHCQR